MANEPSALLTLLKYIKGALVEGLVKYSATEGRIATAREITTTLLVVANTTAKKEPKMPFGRALAALMVEACKYNRELAHAAIDDAFDDEARRRAKTAS